MFEKFKGLFPDKDSENDQDPTIVSDRLQKGNPGAYPALYRVASCQSVGHVRSHNEDTAFTSNTVLSGLNEDLSFGIFLVADGMGGHQNGEIASNLAAQGVATYLIDRLYKPFLFDQEVITDQEVQQHLKHAVEEAQSQILQRVPGGGTTLTLVLALGARLFSAHVGDSRLYVVGPDGQLKLKTRDHSLVKRLIDLGEITEAQAESHPQRNVLYRALGQTDELVADLGQLDLDVGERLLLCSDGLWGAVSADLIQNILASTPDLDKAACDLVKAANGAGGSDNITVLLIQKLLSHK